MFTFLVVVILLVAALMTVVVLLQAGKGGGLSGIAGGGQTQQILGARQAPDFLERATWTLGIVFLVLCVVATFFTGMTESQRSILQERGVGAPSAPSQEAPVSPLPGGDGSAAPVAPPTE